MIQEGVGDLAQPMAKTKPDGTQRIDTMELRKNVPGYQKRLNSRQVPTKYGFFIYHQEVIQLTKGTKKKKAITETKYKKMNRKSYKNIEWLNKMYKRKTKEVLDEYNQMFKVILPLEFPEGYKIFDHKGNYYATVLATDDIFHYLAIQKDVDEIHFFLKDKVEHLYIKAQCGGPYGFIVPEEFAKDYERPG